MSKRRRRKHWHAWHAAIIIGIGLVGLALLFMGGQWLENRMKKPEAIEDYRQRYAYDNTIEVGGVSYRQRKELTTILLMGIDRESDDESVGYSNGGQSDFLRVVIVDPTHKTISQLAIDRDTMTPITVMGVMGNLVNTRTLQICLSHSYGDGKEQSCEFTVEAVSNLLLGTQITHYVAMNLSGISELNDWAGGVTVTLDDDFSNADPAMTKGATLTLVGDQAEIFVRSRMDIGDGTNESRMKRQQQYLQTLSEQMGDQLRADKNNMGTLYDVLEPYLVTDLTRGRLINEAWTARDYEMKPVVDIPGTHMIGSDGFMEFHVDEDALQQIVLDMFYEKVK